MTQQILTPSMIAKEALMQLKNSCVMGNLVHRDYRKEFVKVGQSISIRKPVKFTVTDGATRSNQDVEEGNTTITINKRKHVSWQFSTQDLTLSISEYSERYITPAMITLANQIDVDLAALYKDVWHWVGTPGQTVDSFADLSKGPQRLDEMAVPMDMRRAVLAPADAWGMIGNLTGLGLLPQGGRDNASLEAYRKASLGMVANLDTYQDQNIQRHTVGTGTGTPLTDGSSHAVTYGAVLSSYQQSLVTDGWTASKTLKAGDVFTLDGVYAVNPVSKATLDFLQQFVLVSDVTTNATTTNDTTLTISPPIITSGPYQTVSADPGDGATITYLGTAATVYPQNLVFHKNAFALVTVPLELPRSASFKARENYDGFSIRLVEDYDIDNDVEIIRADVLYGVKTIYPELATRISGTPS